MLIFFSICSLYHGKEIYKDSQKYSFLTALMKNLLIKINPKYQVTIFTSTDLRSLPNYNNIIGMVTRNNPTVITDLTPDKINGIKKLNYYVYSDIYIMFVTDSKQKRKFIKTMMYTSFIRYDTDLSQTSGRLKCLVLFFHKNARPTFKDHHEHITSLVWSRKFLDFSIIDINVEDRFYGPIICYYNDFNKTFITKKYRNDTEIFPDKLKNGYHHTVKISYVKNSRKNETGSLIKDINVLMTMMAFQTLNFSVYVNEVEDKELIAIKFVFHKTNIIAPRQLYVVKDVPIFRFNEECENIIAVVPVLPVSMKFAAPYHALAFILFFILIIRITRYLTKSLQWRTKFWRTFNILEMLLGTSVEIAPQTLIEKIFFMCFTVISIFYSADFFLDIIDIKFVKDGEILDSLEAINKSGLDIYIEKYILPAIDDIENDQLVSSIRGRVIQLQDADDCLESLQKGNKKIICIVDESKAKESITPFSKALGMPPMRIAPNSVFHCKRRLVLLEKASPYTVKLQSIINSLIESGVSQYTENMMKFVVHREQREQEENKDSENTVLKGVFILLAIGYMLSCFAFTCEIFNQHLLTCRKKLQSNLLSMYNIAVSKLKLYNK